LSGSSEAREREPAAKAWAVVIDVSSLDRGSAFWGPLLGVTQIERFDRYALFTDIVEGMRLVLQETNETKTSKNRMHLDITGDDPVSIVSWVLDHGGSIVTNVEATDYALVVMADGDGNEFCINLERR